MSSPFDEIFIKICSNQTKRFGAHLIAHMDFSVPKGAHFDRENKFYLHYRELLHNWQEIWDVNVILDMSTLFQKNTIRHKLSVTREVTCFSRSRLGNIFVHWRIQGMALIAKHIIHVLTMNVLWKMLCLQYDMDLL